MTAHAYGLTKQFYSVREMMEMASLGRNSIYKAIDCGHLKPTKFGKRTLFAAADIAAFIEAMKSGAFDKKADEIA